MHGPRDEEATAGLAGILMGGFHACILTNQRGFEEKESLWKKKHGLSGKKEIRITAC